MKSYVHLLTATCMLVAGGALTISAADTRDVDLDKTASVDTAKPADLTFPPGIALKDLNASSGLERAITDVSAAALSKNGFGTVIGWLADQDKNRLNDKKGMNVDDLNGLVDKLDAMLKVKYGNDFKLEKGSLDNFIIIATGEVTDPELLVGKWPVGAVGGLRGMLDKTLNLGKDVEAQGKVTESDADIAKNKLFGGAVKLEKGRKLALVRFPAVHGNPTITASMIDETTSWRFDIPNTITADQLHASLAKCLTRLSERTEWPADSKDAQRDISQHVIAALYGVAIPAEPMKTASER